MDRRRIRPRLSVRAISAGVMVSLALLSAALAGGVTWLSMMLDRTSEVLTRDARSLQLITETELNLFAYQQASNLLLETTDPGAVAETESDRDALLNDIRAALEATPSYAGSAEELELLRRVGMEIEAYLTVRRELESRGVDARSIWSESGARMTPAVETLEALRLINELELEQARAGAVMRSMALRAAAVATALVGVLLLAVIALWSQRALLRPIVAIRDAIEKYREGEEPPRLGEGMARELDEIASAFEAMSATLARRRAEQAAFLAGVAHELRNPLSALTSSAAVLSDAVTEQGRPAVAILDRQLTHLSRLVDELLDIGRTAAGEIDLERSHFDLRDSVRAVLELYRSFTQEHRLESILPDEPVMIVGDARRIEQVLGNLVSNAIKYSPHGGTIVISLSESGDEASIAVSDEGIGIPPSEIEELFAPFRRRSTDRHGIPGAGLGLYVVRRIVAAHGGRIEVESEPERGSVFRVCLPLPGTEPDVRRAGEVSARR